MHDLGPAWLVWALGVGFRPLEVDVASFETRSKPVGASIRLPVHGPGFRAHFRDRTDQESGPKLPGPPARVILERSFSVRISFPGDAGQKPASEAWPGDRKHHLLAIEVFFCLDQEVATKWPYN